MGETRQKKRKHPRRVGGWYGQKVLNTAEEAEAQCHCCVTDNSEPWGFEAAGGESRHLVINRKTSIPETQAASLSECSVFNLAHQRVFQRRQYSRVIILVH